MRSLIVILAFCFPVSAQTLPSPTPIPTPIPGILYGSESPSFESSPLDELEKLELTYIKAKPKKEWIEIARSNDPQTGFVIYYRPSLVVGLLGSRETWLRILLNKPQTRNRGKIKTVVVSRTEYVSAACSQRRLTVSDISEFDAGGKVVSYHKHDQANYFIPVAPDSIGETILETLCN